MSKETSAYVAKMAAVGVKTPAKLSQKAIKAICASALSQTEDDVLPPWDKLSSTKKRMFHERLTTTSPGAVSYSATYTALRRIFLS